VILVITSVSTFIFSVVNFQQQKIMFSLYFRLKAHLDAKGGPRKKKKKKRVRRNEAGKYGLKYMYRQTCFKRSLLGERKSGLIRQVTS